MKGKNPIYSNFCLPYPTKIHMTLEADAICTCHTFPGRYFFSCIPNNLGYEVPRENECLQDFFVFFFPLSQRFLYFINLHKLRMLGLVYFGKFIFLSGRYLHHTWVFKESSHCKRQPLLLSSAARGPQGPPVIGCGLLALPSHSCRLHR